jgi:hypothetical protein
VPAQFALASASPFSESAASAPQIRELAMVEVNPPSEFEVLQGVPAIWRRMVELLRRPDLTERQVYYYLQLGIWPGIHRGGKWELRPARLLEEIRRDEDAALAARQARLAAAKAGNGEQHGPPEAPRPQRLRGRPRRGRSESTDE